jgi:DNA-binding NarL/FixJ family response regulator
MEWLSTHTADVVILDYSLKDGPCTRLARALREHGIPFVVYSGHQRTIAPWSFKACRGSLSLVIDQRSWQL